MDWIPTWFPVVASLMTVIIIPVVTWAIRMGLVTQTQLAAERHERERADQALDARITDVDRRLDRGEDRFERLDLRLKELPTRTDMHSLSSSIHELAGSVGGLAVQVSGLDGRLDRTDARITSMDELLRADTLARARG